MGGVASLARSWSRSEDHKTTWWFVQLFGKKKKSIRSRKTGPTLYCFSLDFFTRFGVMDQFASRFATPFNLCYATWFLPPVTLRERENREGMESNQKSEEKQGDGGYKTDKIHKARLISTLTALLEDPVLSDVHKNPSLSDVDTLIGLELGSAMRISILKFDGTTFDVVVMNSATVKDLKLAIMKKVNDVEQSKMGHRHISWRHVWANYCLSYNSEKLIDDPGKLQDFGIRTNSRVQFTHFVVSRLSHRHSKRRKHRFFHGLNKR